MHQRHRAALVVDGVLDRATDQALGAIDRHRLDADGRGLGKADLGHAHFLLQEFDDFFHFRRAGFPFHAGVDVFGVFAKDHHVDLFRCLDRGGHASEVTHRAQAHIQIEHLAQRDVERAHAARGWRGQRALDRDDVVLHRLHGFVGQPLVGAIDLGRFFTSEHFHPGDLLLAAVSLGHRSIYHATHGRGDIDAGAVAFDEGNDRGIGHVQRVVGVDGDFFACGGNLDMCGHDVSKR